MTKVYFNPLDFVSTTGTYGHFMGTGAVYGGNKYYELQRNEIPPVSKEIENETPIEWAHRRYHEIERGII